MIRFLLAAQCFVLAVAGVGCASSVVTGGSRIDKLIDESWRDTKGFTAKFRLTMPPIENAQESSIMEGTVSFRGTSSSFEYRIEGKQEMIFESDHFRTRAVYVADGEYGYMVFTHLPSEPPYSPESGSVSRAPLSVRIPGVSETPVHPALSLRVEDDLSGMRLEEVDFPEHGRVYLLTFPTRVGMKLGQVRLYFSKYNGVPLKQELYIRYEEGQAFEVFEVVEYRDIIINPVFSESEFIFEVPSGHKLTDYQNGKRVDVENYTKW